MPDNSMCVRIRMLEEENLYKQQDLKKGNSTLIGFESLCFSCLIAPHLYRVRVTRVQDVMGSTRLLHLNLTHCHSTHTHLHMLMGFRGNDAHRQTNVWFSDNCMQVTVPWL